MFPESDLQTALQKTITLYNRTHSPNVTAKLVTATSTLAVVQFSGGFCLGCGVFEYVEGFAAQLKMLSGKFELKAGKTREVSPRIFEVDYAVKTY